MYEEVRIIVSCEILLLDVTAIVGYGVNRTTRYRRSTTAKGQNMDTDYDTETREEVYEIDLELMGLTYGTAAVISGIREGTFFMTDDGTDLVHRELIGRTIWNELVDADIIGKRVTA